MGPDKWGQAPFFKKDDILTLRTKQQKMGTCPNFSKGFALLSLGEEPCPFSLSHGFSPYSLRQAGNPAQSSSEYVWAERVRQPPRREDGVKNLIGSDTVSQNLLKKKQIKTQVLQVWPHSFLSFCWPLPCKNNNIEMGFRSLWLS